MKRILITILWVLLTVPVAAQRGHFFPSERFSSGLISDLCQDKEGSVWIGTDYGLNRFAGYHFQTFPPD